MSRIRRVIISGPSGSGPRLSSAGPVMSFLFGLLIFVVMGFTTGLPNE